MKTFKVTVDGQTYSVEVEEVKQGGKGLTSGGLSPASAAAETAAPAAASPSSAPAVKKAEEQKKSPVKQEAPPVQKKPESAAAASGAEGFSVKAPMPGSVIEVKVNVGDVVAEGDVLLVLEAMKMENELTASQAGTVAEILVKKGDTVNSGAPLIILS